MRRRQRAIVEPACIEQRVGGDAGKVRNRPAVAGQKGRLHVKATRMKLVREISKRLWRVARAVKQQHRRRVRAPEHESVAADDHAVRPELTAPRRQLRESSKVHHSPHGARDDQRDGSGQQH